MEENTSSGGDTIVYNIDTSGIEHRLDAVSETLQAINEPGLDKLFYDYNATETLLVLLLVCVVVHWCVCMIKRGFSWLL